MTLYQVLALIKKDWLLEWSYPLSFFSHLAGMVVHLTLFYFLSRLMPDQGRYFNFVVVGLSCSTLFSAALYGLSSSVRNEQLMGTLETLCASPVSFGTILMAKSLFSLGYAAIETFTYLAAAAVLFGFSIHLEQMALLLLVVLLSLTAFLFMGLISAGWVIRFKRGDPASWLITLATQILSGVFFPISLLPNWLQTASSLSPLTHALNGIRPLLQEHSSELHQTYSAIYALSLFIVVLGPLSLAGLKWSLRSCLRHGTLGDY